MDGLCMFDQGVMYVIWGDGGGRGYNIYLFHISAKYLPKV